MFLMNRFQDEYRPGLIGDEYSTNQGYIVVAHLYLMM